MEKRKRFPGANATISAFIHLCYKMGKIEFIKAIVLNCFQGISLVPELQAKICIGGESRFSGRSSLQHFKKSEFNLRAAETKRS